MKTPLRTLGAGVLVALLVHPAAAAPGDLDTTFGGTGVVTTTIGTITDVAKSVAVQADGKILAAGYSKAADFYANFALVRYNVDGTLDATFGSGGKLTTSIGSYDDNGNSVVVQSDGKIIVAGTANISLGDFALVRYNADGTLDTSFGNAGKAVTDFCNMNYGICTFTDEHAVSVALQSDGKIVVAGDTWDPYGSTNPDFAVVRYNANGTLDATFNGGKVTTDFNSSYDYGYSMAVQGDGKIVVAGYSQGDFAVARYSAGGTLDATFGSGGKVTTDFAGGSDIGRSVAVQGDGKIVVAGSALIAGNNDLALVRYNANGTLDASFGNGGKVTTDTGDMGDLGYSVAVLGNGKIVVAGTSARNFVIARYDANGTLDATFGNGGKVITDIGGDDSGYAMAVQGDGNIVVAGSSYAPFTTSKTIFAVARYLGDASGSPSDSDRVFNWAEAAYSQYFIPRGATAQTAQGYYYRYYSQTNVFLATKDSRVYLYGPSLFGPSILDLGLLSVWLPQAQSAGY